MNDHPSVHDLASNPDLQAKVRRILDAGAPDIVLGTLCVLEQGTPKELAHFMPDKAEWAALDPAAKVQIATCNATAAIAMIFAVADDHEMAMDMLGKAVADAMRVVMAGAEMYREKERHAN